MSGSPSGQYDPYLGRDSDPYANRNDGREGGAPAATAESEAGGDSRTQALQAQIDDTVGVMRENIQKVSQRGQNLDALQDKTDELAMSAQNFRRGANRVRKQMWWKDVKMRFCIAGGIIILLAIIIIPSVLATKK